MSDFDVLFIAEPEGAVRCNDCPGYEFIDGQPEDHAREVHGTDLFTVVHPDDHGHHEDADA